MLTFMSLSKLTSIKIFPQISTINKDAFHSWLYALGREYFHLKWQNKVDSPGDRGVFLYYHYFSLKRNPLRYVSNNCFGTVGLAVPQPKFIHPSGASDTLRVAPGHTTPSFPFLAKYLKMCFGVLMNAASFSVSSSGFPSQTFKVAIYRLGLFHSWLVPVTSKDCERRAGPYDSNSDKTIIPFISSPSWYSLISCKFHPRMRVTREHLCPRLKRETSSGIAGTFSGWV